LRLKRPCQPWGLRSISLFFLLLFFAGSSIQAQKNYGKISGVVVSDSAAFPVPDATITLMRSRDSSLERMVVTDNKGRFSLHNIALGDYLLLISEVSHENISRTLSLTSNTNEIYLDTFRLKTRNYSLDSIIITRMIVPIVIKPDTIEFNAGSFKVKDNDMVEDLLKKLPGVEVARDGTITAQGEKVTQVLVDGKPFFGSDPKTATQNLPADIIDKVQVIDQKTERARVTKIDDGETQKVINITIKKSKKVGSFGRAYAGYGTNERYEGRVSGNYFNDARKMAVVAGSNNTGRADYGTGTNELNTSYNNSNGINKDIQSRFTYADKWGKKLTVSGDFGYFDNSNNTQQVRNRQTILGDSTNFYLEQSLSKRTRTGYSGGLNLTWEADSMTRMIVHQSGNIFKNKLASSSSFNSSTSEGRKINEGDRTNTNILSSPVLNGTANISRSFRKRGRGLFLNFSNNFNNSHGDGFIVANNFFYPYSEPDYAQLLDQHVRSDNNSFSFSSSIAYNEPLSTKSSLAFNVAYNYNKNNTLKETYDFNPASLLYDLYNDTLSTHFDNLTRTTTAGVAYSYMMKKGNLSVGTNWQNNETISNSVSTKTSYSQNFAGLAPYAAYTFFTKGKHLHFGYNYNTRAPLPYQLQPVVDNSNPLYLRLGNPNLRFSVMHRFTFSMNIYQQKSGMNINANANYSTTSNSISTSTVFDPVTGIQVTMPVNLNGVYNGAGRIYMSHPINAFGNKNSLFTSVGMNFNRNLNLLNLQKNITRLLLWDLNAGFSIGVAEVVSVNLGGNARLQSVQYSLQKNQNNRTIAYGTNTVLRLTPNKLSELQVSWDYDRNTGSAEGFNRVINLVNADLTQYLGKKKNFWLKLKVYDLLKQNINIYRYSGENFIEDIQTNILTRFFLLSFNARFNKFTKGK
jgi:hypothetical protein